MNAPIKEAEVLAVLARHPTSAKIAAEEHAHRVTVREALLPRRRQLEQAAEAAWHKEAGAEELAVAGSGRLKGVARRGRRAAARQPGPIDREL